MVAWSKVSSATLAKAEVAGGFVPGNVLGGVPGWVGWHGCFGHCVITRC